MNTSITTKNWQTNIGAFGTTEKKFAMLNTAEEKPGPGAYRSQSFATKKYTQ
jgi:hypothetical protein